VRLSIIPIAIAITLIVLAVWPAASGGTTEPAPEVGFRRAAASRHEPHVAPVEGTSNGQTQPAAIADGYGGMLVAWVALNGGAADIHIRSLDSDGTTRWPTIKVCGANGNQDSPRILSDGLGGAIVAWRDYRAGISSDIYARHVLINGALDPAWPADGRALCVAPGDQNLHAMVTDGANGAIVAWDDARGGASDIYAQRVLASGAVDPAWPADGRALCTATGDQNAPAMVADGAGGAIVAWTDSRGGNSDIYAQRVLASGAVDPAWPADGRALCTAAGDQGSPAIVSDGVGGAIVTWEDSRSGTADIYAQRVLASGAVDPAWPADGRALCAASGVQSSPSGVTDGRGGAIVTWEDSRSDTADIYVQRILASGALDPALPADGRALCTATGAQSTPAIVSDGRGGAIVTWEDFRGGATADIYAQRLMWFGAVDHTWPADGRAMCTATADQLGPTIVSDDRGGAIVTWEDYRAGDPVLHAARVTTTGAEAPAWTANGAALCTAPLVQASPTIAPDGGGGAIVAWRDDRNGGKGVYAQRILATDALDPAWPVNGRALCTGVDVQRGPAIVTDGAAGAIVIWEDIRGGASESKIYAQHVLAGGNVDPLWPANGLALCTAVGVQSFAVIVADGRGGAIVAWSDQRSGITNSDIYAQRVLASGALDPAWPSDGLAVCTAKNHQVEVDIVQDGRGGAIVTWTDYRSGVSPDIYDTYANLFTQHVLASGVVDPAWPADGRPLCAANGAQSVIANVPDGRGGAIVAWQDNRGAQLIYVQRMRASGDVAWQANGFIVCNTAGSQYSPTLIPDGTGGAIVTWMDNRGGDYEIYARRVLASGALDSAWPAGGCLVGAVNDPNFFNPVQFSAVPDGAGGAIITWYELRNTSDDIYAQRVLANGVVDPSLPAGGRALCTAPENQQGPVLVQDGAGGAIVAWQDGRSSTPSLGTFDIYAQRITPTGPMSTPWTPDGVTSVQLSLQSAEAEPGAVRLAWHTSQAGLEAVLSRREQGGEWSVLTALVSDGSGHLRYVDETVAPGRRYGYRLGVRTGETETDLGEVWITVPSDATLGIEGLRPNPASRDLVVAFSLAQAGEATLEVLDVAGRRVIVRRLTEWPAGNHVLSLGHGRPLAAGVYLLRLTQAGRSVTARASVVR
jgi:hypothetical protein